MRNPDTEKIYQLILGYHGPTKIMIAECLRKGFAFDNAIPADFHPEVKRSERRIPGSKPDQEIRCLVYTPPVANPPILFYIHGGGWSLESPDDYGLFHKKLSAMAGMTIFALDYRLAPEHPFPSGLEDCVTAYRWLRQHAAELGADSKRIYIGGDSAGGNLTPATALKLRELGEAPPQALICLCPVTDFRFEGYDSWRRLAFDGIVYDASFLGAVRGGYVNCDAWDHPLVSPLYGDLRGLPPTCLIAGDEDPLVDDNRAFAQKLRDAGVAVDFKVYEGMPHAFYCFSGLVPQEQAALEQITRFLSSLK
ncbi:MAG: alpha/beta hydrolase [Deltaproteobacteria bacterium]|nr:alpha/beta hydrolase [Deltaproteobacteria bacterium]